MSPGRGTPIAVTIDLEDAHHGLGVSPRSSTLVSDTHWILDRFDEHHVQGTFFVLGELIESHADLIGSIAARGHEIGFHGDRHCFLRDLGRTEFRRGLTSRLPQLKDICQQEISGFRAPFFSLQQATEWVLQALADEGFTYDASIYPGRNDRYGWDGAPDTPVLHADTGLRLFPVPMLHPRFRIAFSGGAYLRALPRPVIRWGLKRQLKQGRPGMVYLHPWEVAHTLPWRSDAALRPNLTRHFRRRGMRERVRALLREHADRLAPMGEVLDSLDGLPSWRPTRDGGAKPTSFNPAR